MGLLYGFEMQGARSGQWLATRSRWSVVSSLTRFPYFKICAAFQFDAAHHHSSLLTPHYQPLYFSSQICYDVENNSGHVFDIEMQCTNGSDQELPKRTRYYQGMIDMGLLEKGGDYDTLNPSFIIFICTFDPFHKGLPIYTFRNRCVECEGLELQDEATKIFLNSKSRDENIDPDIAAFLRYVDGKSAEGSFTQTVEQEVLRVKRHDETRREYMTLAMELKRRDRISRQEGLAEGRALEKEKNHPYHGRHAYACRNYCSSHSQYSRICKKRT